MSATAAPVTPPRLGLVTGFVLLVASGFVDAYTFLRHGHVFAEAITGNLVLIGIGAFDQSIVAFWRPLTSVAAFVLGVVILTQAVRWLAAEPAVVQLAALAVEVAVLVAVGCAPPSFPQAPVVCAIALAAGMQNTAFRRVGEATMSTVVMTMNSTQLVGSLLTALQTGDREALRRARALGVAFTGFIAGVFLGAGLSTVMHDRAAWVDAALYLVAGTLYLARDRRGLGVAGR